jgi:hypothetical protein
MNLSRELKLGIFAWIKQQKRGRESFFDADARSQQIQRRWTMLDRPRFSSTPPPTAPASRLNQRP